MTERPLSRHLTRGVSLRDLEAKATPGPWAAAHKSGKKPGGLWAVRPGPSPNIGLFISNSDALLTANLRNAAPFLLDVVEAARDMYAYMQQDYPSDSIDFAYAGEAIDRLDSHLSAASERETPE